nr:virulence factor SrfC family protein [uncultured Capnocytophaga sp.]
MRSNYSQQDIEVIKSFIQQKKHLVHTTVEWVERNLKYEDRNEVLLQLKGAVNTFNKILQNIDSKPVMALFGASQVGKSYLIKNLLSTEKNPFEIQNGSTAYDFLQHINPAGGKESTGLVTRFTIKQEVKYSEFPVKVKLLNAKDILIIILDSFFLDLKKITTFISKRDLEAHIKRYELQSAAIQQEHLTEFDILEIKDYFDHHLSKHTILFEGLVETRFFQRIAKIIAQFDYTQWSGIFEVLWNKNEHLTQIFNSIIEKLHTLNYTTEAYLKFDNVLREQGGILDVERIKQLEKVHDETIVKTAIGNEVSIDINYLSVLIMELIFSIPESLVHSKRFLQNSDLLDFPGARTRLAIEEAGIANEDNQKQMLIRGKVSYLFNRYSDDYSINNLLFCNNDKQLEVNELSYLLFNWISKNIGETQEQRSLTLANASIPPLFVIYTFFNEQLYYKDGADNNYLNDYTALNHKWIARFNAIFEGEIVTKSRNWHTHWALQSPCFKNMYLLRDFNYSKHTFNGFETEKKETELRPDRVGFMNALRKSFIEFDFVKKHFDTPEVAWDAAAQINADGSQLIVENLEKVSNNFIKINHYIAILNETLLQLKTVLNKYLHTDDVQAMRNKNMQLVTQFQLQFNRALTLDFSLFNKFIEQLSVTPIQLYNLLNEHLIIDVEEETHNNLSDAAILFTQYPELQNATTEEEVVNILKTNMWLSSKEEVEKQLELYNIKISDLFTPAKTKTKAEHYTELMLENWRKQLTNNPFTEFTQYNITKSNIEAITEHYQTIIKKRNIEDKLVKVFDNMVSEIKGIQGEEVFMAETFALLLNDIIYNFDMQFISSDEAREIKEMLKDKPHTYFLRENMTDDNTIATLFDNTKMDVNTIALEKYNRWMELLRISLLINSGFVNYNETENNTLKALLEQYTNFDEKVLFSLN